MSKKNGTAGASPAPIEPSVVVTARPEPSTDDRAGRDPGDLGAALSPRQIIGGFALLAGLILMVRRSRRRKG